MEFFTPLTSFVFFFLILAVLYTATRFVLSTLRPSNYPPGPPPLPILGNLRQIPLLHSHLALASWAQKYGPLTGLKLGPLNIIVLNSATLVYELLVKRAASFNERHPPYIAGTHVLPEGRDSYTLFMSQEWSMKLRTLTKNTLVGGGLANLVPLQKASGMRLVWALFESAKNGGEAQWEKCLQPWALAGPVALVSGAPIEDFIRDFGERWVQDYYLSQYLWIEMLDPTNPLAQLFPLFRMLPSQLTQWKRKASVARNYLMNSYYGLLEQGRKSTKRQGGSFSPLALIPRILREKRGREMTTEEERATAVYMGGLFDAAAGSTLMSIQTLILALASHPDAQRRAQAEIDAVFGETIPDKIEVPKLPYLHACVCESQRWRSLGAYPLQAFGLPRKTSADEQVRGYHIPKGTLVVVNQWSIAHDPEFYEKPEEYNPERFYQDPVGAKPGVSEVGRKAVYTFGAGRRECLGKEFFFQNVKIAMAQLLWAFDVVADGELETSAERGFTPSTVMMPLPFKVKFVPRRSEGVLLEERLKADTAMTEILGQRV